MGNKNSRTLKLREALERRKKKEIENVNVL